MDWHARFPLAVAEHSDPLTEFKRGPDNPDGSQYWENDLYSVTVRHHESDPVFGSRGGMIQLGINSADGTARHDWRHFQEIKNRFAGPEAEAFELYPAESRLLDPSNYYSLWCFPSGRIKVGQRVGRQVWDADESPAPQRALK